MVTYTSDLDGIDVTHLDAPFFVGWPNPPNADRHLDILRAASVAVIAVEGERVVGFATALTDGVLVGFISLLEVTPSHRGRGIGTELVRRVVAALGPLYAIDAVCDAEVVPFYERIGFVAGHAAMRREYELQPGRD